MHLPEPALTFTLPSIHDGKSLDCRVYHPLSLSSSTRRPIHAAIVAHPYAPLGGCYDDPVVEEVASQLLRRGFVVGTFNFRGAGHSAGRTSWTARPERDDYASLIGFLVYYTHHIDASRLPGAKPPVLILAGYSYGAMVTSQLPPIAAVLAPFVSPSASSDAGQIRLRAETLGKQQGEMIQAYSARSLRVGEGGSPKKSHDGRRSFSLDDVEEVLRYEAHDFTSKTRHQHNPTDGASPSRQVASVPPQDVPLVPICDLVRPQAAYLLISPLQGIITHLATMSRSPGDAAAEAKLRQNPTLAVYGDGDVFVSSSRLRSWARRMEGSEGSHFLGREVEGAGHFWVEEGALERMAQLVSGFAKALVDEG